MLIENALIVHLEEIQKTATKRVEEIIDDLKAKVIWKKKWKILIYFNWVRTMNFIKEQAEEIVYNEIIYK